ncbi:MAG: Fic family protein [bacterium]
MFETILTTRQKYILNLVGTHNGIKQPALLKLVQPIYPTGKVTLLRDLSILNQNKLIRVEGKAQNTTYIPLHSNPLLIPFDPERYFVDPADVRPGVKQSFTHDIFDHLHDLLLPSELDTLKSHLIFSESTQTIGQTIRKRELERFCVELSWKSSEIEGNTYSLFETDNLLMGGTKAPGKTPAETQMILNHKTAFDTILEYRLDFKDLTSSLLLELHNQLAYKLDIDTGIRQHAVGITGTRYLPLGNAHQLREYFDKIIETINNTKHPFEKALIAGTMIPYLQPFADGNKRTGRMLTNAILLAHDYYPLSYRSVEKNIFKKALLLFYEQNSLVAFKNLLLEQLQFSHSHYFRTK